MKVEHGTIISAQKCILEFTESHFSFSSNVSIKGEHVITLFPIKIITKNIPLIINAISADGIDTKKDLIEAKKN